ncbi:response regulator [Spirosoma gilvum]
MNTEKGAEIWVVDDDADDHLLMAYAVSGLAAQIQIKPIENGEELITSLAQVAVLPKLVFLDINMNRLNGLDVLGQIRAHSQYDSMPIVILTTSNSVLDRERAQALGANAFLTKPSHIDQLRILIESVLEDLL